MPLPVILFPNADNELMIEKIKSFNNKIYLECELSRQMYPVLDSNTNVETFPVILFSVNEFSDFVLPVAPVFDLQNNPDNLMNEFIAALVKFEIFPTKIIALNNYTLEFFKPFCEKLGIEVVYSSRPSDYMEEVQCKTLDDLDSQIGLELSDEQNEQLDVLMNAIESLYQGNISQEEFLNELNSNALNLPEFAKKELFRIINGIDAVSQDDDIIEINSHYFDDIDEDKTYVISVSLFKGCYRHIKISGICTLDDLHTVINEAFSFDDDHLHVFYMKSKSWYDEEAYYDYRAEQGGVSTSDITLNELNFSVGEKFKYVFDFGDNWQFQCKVIKVLDEYYNGAKVIKLVGDAPPQYPDCDDDGILPQ